MNSAQVLRQAIRGGRHNGLTTGCAPGHLQANLVVLPQSDASEFLQFCAFNPMACPVLGVGEPGAADLPALAADLNLRTDLSGYLVHREGLPPQLVDDITNEWRDDLVAIAIGCWFSVEDALAVAGIRQRHRELGIQGPLFRTNRETVRAGHFGGPLVVSMRPFAANDVPAVERITAGFPQAHGAPLHAGDAGALGIADVSMPDYGEPLLPQAGEVPLYWPCGLTAMVALQQARLPLFITHAPGRMLVTDLRSDPPRAH
ncbi:MAG: DUF1445 domain-containing protein [Haliea sp.]|nr:MAG: DUF1445 domain-containing protein [Haliea sp.]